MSFLVSYGFFRLHLQSALVGQPGCQGVPAQHRQRSNERLATRTLTPDGVTRDDFVRSLQVPFFAAAEYLSELLNPSWSWRLLDFRAQQIQRLNAAGSGL